MYYFKNIFNLSGGGIYVSHISRKFTYTSFRDVYLFLLFFISTSSKVGLRISKYNNKNNYRYTYASYSYNKSNQTFKISPV